MFYLIILPFVVLAIRTLFHVYSSTLLDFSMYLSATNYFLSGHNPYMAVAPQVYPPAFLFIMVPFAVLPEQLARTLWTTLSIASFFLAIHFLLPRLSIKIQVLLGLIALQLFPVKYALAQGQINFFVFLGFVLIFRLATKNKDLLAGLTLALITIMKLSPILLILYFLILKKYRLIFYCLASLALLNIIVDLPSAHHLTQSFIDGTFFRTTNPPLGYYNQSLPALLHRLNLSFTSNYLALFFLALTSVSFIKNPSQTKKYFVLFLVTILLISPITWQHYLFWSIPAFLYLISNTKNTTPWLVLLSFILINLNIKNSEPLNNWQFFYSHATLGLLLLYFLVLIPKSKKIPGY